MLTSWRTIVHVAWALAAANACGGRDTSSSGKGTPAGSDASNDAGATGTECYGPADCPSATPICCATIQLAQQSATSTCELAAVLSACKASCATSEQPLACPLTQTVELCSAASNCTDPSYPKCCSVGYAGGGPGRTATFCVDPASASALQNGVMNNAGVKGSCL